MSSGNYPSQNLNGSPTKRRAKPQSTSSANHLTQTQPDPDLSRPTLGNRNLYSKPKSANGINGDSLRDTSVNVASAFTQAVQDFTMSQPATNGYSTGVRNGVTDVSHRGLGAPPPSRAKKPTSRRLNGADSIENEHEMNRLRGKSPLAEAASSFVRALSPGGSLYLRQRGGAGDDEPSSFQSLTGAMSGLKHQASQSSTRPAASQSQTSHGNVSSDYNYSREESMVNKMDPPAKPANAARKPRQSGMIDYDKQAYRPPVEEEEEEDDWSEDEKGFRRRRSTKGPAKKQLDHLPTVGAQAKHRRRRKGKSGADDGSESESLHPGDPTIRSIRGSIPPVQDSLDSAGYAADATGSMDQPEFYADEYAIADSQAHPSQEPFSVGGLLGKFVNIIIRLAAGTLAFTINLLTSVVVLTVRLFASFVDVVVLQPASLVADRLQKVFGAVEWLKVGKAIIALLVIWMFINSLFRPASYNTPIQRDSWIPWKQNQRPPIDYDTPGMYDKAVLDLARRLQEAETKLVDMQYAQRRAYDRLDSQARMVEESGSRLSKLDSALSNANRARIEAEEQLRSSSAASVQHLRAEISSMISQIGHQNSVSIPDERLATLERRLQAAEAGLKDAIESSKQALNSASSKAPSGPSESAGAGWWNKLAGSDGRTSLTIKSSDGRDVTGLIGSLVDSAILRWSKDDIAKPDYASYFAGGRVIPQLTTQTYRIETKSYWGNWGWFGTPTEGRPPITALHPDTHVGNCWPFKGSHGQIGVMLARSIIPTEFTIDHAAKEVAFDVRSAPKKMEVWGLVDGAENVKKVADYHRRREQRYRDLVTAASREGRTPPPPEDPYPPTLPPDAHYLRLAQFTYDVNAPSHIQTFPVPEEIQNLGVDVGVVVLIIRNNWGEPNWTCLYRFRVHGHDMDRRPYPLTSIDD